MAAEEAKMRDEKGEWTKFVFVGKNNRKVYLTHSSLNIIPLNNSLRFKLIRLIEWNRFD